MLNIINYTCAKICPVVGEAQKDNLALASWIDDLRAEIKQLADYTVDQQDTVEALIGDLLSSINEINEVSEAYSAAMHDNGALREELGLVQYRNQLLTDAVAKASNALSPKCNRGGI